MKRKKVVIIGGGISGLSAAWYLQQSRYPLEITLLEKTSRCGGWLHTDYSTGFHFEKGPRAFQSSRSSTLLELIAELGLQEQVIGSSLSAKNRYLWHEGQLHRFSVHPLALLFSPLTKGLLRALFNEWRQPTKEGDETVWEFAVRRFNYDVARLLFDPLVIGIFGGDIRKISVRACFPRLKRWEEKYGSITRGFLAQRREKKATAPFSAGIFSLKGGVEQLIHALVAKLDIQILYEQRVKQIQLNDIGAQVNTEDAIFDADLLFCALPARETGEFLKEGVPQLSQELNALHSQGIVVVSVAYEASVLPVEGFGYLTSSYANEDILGAVFDSSVFPQHNNASDHTRLTIKMEDRGGNDDEYLQKAQQGLRSHLGICRTPTSIHLKRAARAIPQYGVGHLDRMAQGLSELAKSYPQCRLVGNYLTGVSVDACVAHARTQVSEALKALDFS